MKKIWKWLAGAWINVWKWLKTNLTDWKTLVIFLIVYLIVTSEVWVCYLLGWVFHSSVLIGIATSCLAFWSIAPCTPLLPICLGITIGIKKLLEKIKLRKEGKANEIEKIN